MPALAFLLLLLSVLPFAPAVAVEGQWVHAYAAFGEPKYPRGFTHFDYANPDAPKGGTLYLRNPDRRSSFDKFNYFTVKGNAPAGLQIFMNEPLAIRSGDEPMTMYGLLAEEILVAPDKSSITFRLNPKARFNNGDPVLAEDVKHSFDTLTGKYAAPVYQTGFAGAEKAVVLDERTVRFDLRDRSIDTLFSIGTSMRIFSRKWGTGPDGKAKRFDEIITEYPIISGPYLIDVADSGRRLEFKRRADYWAKDHPVRRGFFNFDRVVYRFYKDEAVATEAFKAGEFDIVKVYGARTWVRQHQGAKWRDGRIKKDQFDTETGQGLQSYHINLRRPIFQDVRVREALTWSYDYDTNNRYRMFHRASSLFNNSEFAAKGLPSPGELKLLEPFRSELPPQVFGPPYVAPSTLEGPAAVRRNLLRARALLEEAGWKLDKDGVLRNAKGEPFEFEYMSAGEQVTREQQWQRNLDKLGIKLNIRQVDFALYRRRLEQYDFDIVTIVEGDFTLPSAADYTTLYGSKSADEPGNNNFRGVKSKAVDHILDALSNARTMQELLDACRALDRVVMWNHWQMPELWFAAEPASYWDKFGIPRVRPKYFTIDSGLTDLPAWPVTAWWIKDAAKR